jgi:hypothetical protein
VARSTGTQLRAWWRMAACALLLAAGQAPLLAHADAGPAPVAQTKYRELIAKALQEYALGHWPEARVFFADAHALWPNARTFRGLGMTCYEARNYVEAIDYLEHALESQAQPLTPKLANEARSILEQARQFVSRLELEVAPASAEVELDDHLLQRRADGSVLLDPGEHPLEVSAVGYHTFRRTLVAEAGRPLRVHVELDAEVGDSAPSALHLGVPGLRDLGPQPAAAPGHGPHLIDQRPVVAGILSGVGVAGLGAGWVLYAFRNDARIALWRQGLTAANGGGLFDRDLLQQHQGDGIAALSVAAAGALLLSAAPYFWLPDEVETPTWAWVVGGAGAAAALAGLGLALFADHCSVSDPFYYCQLVSSDPLFAPMLALQALPFLSVPALYMLRQHAPESPLASLRIAVLPGRSGSMLSVGGAF